MLVWVEELRLDAQLLPSFAANRLDRMLVGFDMATRWQPQPSQVVLDEQDATLSLVKEQGVTHKMRCRCCGLGSPEHVAGGCKPGQRLSTMLHFKHVEG